jgi:hypothetical protein
MAANGAFKFTSASQNEEGLANKRTLVCFVKLQ